MNDNIPEEEAVDGELADRLAELPTGSFLMTIQQALRQHPDVEFSGRSGVDAYQIGAVVDRDEQTSLTLILTDTEEL